MINILFLVAVNYQQIDFEHFDALYEKVFATLYVGGYFLWVVLSFVVYNRQK